MSLIVYVSKYQEIARVLHGEIRVLPDGHRAPSEHEVAQRFGVARSTARAALQRLTALNVIRRVRGVGSFVSHRIDYPIAADHAPSWSATVRASGAVPRSAVLSCTHEHPPVELRDKLALAAAERCHRLVRLSYVNEIPSAWGVEWVPTALVPDLAVAMRVNDSLHDVLLNAGVTPRRSWVHASAEQFDSDVAAQLNAPEASLGWYIESLNVDADDHRPVSLSQRWIRADILRVIFQVAMHPAADTSTGAG
ncbi:GntR family transcriptional regulator [Mycobacterium sp. pUA109]|uniref:GntR family transcriptional regulator n=1 Tax=Mycobacterium sp. pUA109 TaxID=3238982 RepID=UPI00351B8CC6